MGIPILDTNTTGYSAARTEYDGWSGIKSADARIQRDLDEMLLFFNTHNTRPIVRCQIHGWHMETKTREVRVENGNFGIYETETYVEQTNDFIYKIDLTPFIYPFGYLQVRAAPSGSSPPRAA